MKPYLKNLSIILLLGLMFSSCASRALQMDTPMFDPMSGHDMLKTQAVKIAYSSEKGSSDYLEGYFTIQSGKYYFFHLLSNLNAYKRNPYEIKRGYNLTLSTKSDSAFWFTNSVDTTAQDVRLIYNTRPKHYWSAETLYVISSDDMKRLAKASFNKARIQTTDGEHEFLISPEQSDGINELVTLAMKNGPDQAQFTKK